MEMSTGVSLLRTAQSLLSGRTIHIGFSGVCVGVFVCVCGGDVVITHDFFSLLRSNFVLFQKLVSVNKCKILS